MASADGRFLLDGKPFIMAAGEMHPQRVPNEYWDHRIKMIRAMGFNTISIYDFWSEHVTDYDRVTNEPAYDFARGRNNLPGFLDLCKANNMWVFLRPGPFVDAYWDLGGIPGYLLATDDVKLRSSTDDAYMEAVESYISTIAPIVSERLTGKGGPILMVQVENEYTSYGYDTRYLSSIRALWEKYGIGGSASNHNVLLSTNNGIAADGRVFNPASALIDQPIGGDPLDIGAGSGAATLFDRTYARYEQAIFSAETYSGWDTLGSSDSMYPEDDNVREIGALVARFLHQGISFSVYVAHGGTSFGYGASGNYDVSRGLFDPNVTSYDYRAPINEQGSKAYNRADALGRLSRSTFDDIRAAFDAALKGETSPGGQSHASPYSLLGPLDGADAATALSALPDPPAPMPMIALSRHRISLAPLATIWDNLSSPIHSDSGPKACEAVGMYSGCGAVYSTETPALSGIHYLTLTALADVATVFLNGRRVAMIDRRVRRNAPLGLVSLGDASAGSAGKSIVRLDFGNGSQRALIDIFVYTFGHAHKEFTGISGNAFRKGIWGPAYLASQPTTAAQRIMLPNWRIHPLPMNSATYIRTLKPLAAGRAIREGMFYSASFTLDAIGDTYIDISTWNLGVIWVNGHNIGRHFASTSPQQALFCPALYLKRGANQIILFDNCITEISNVYIELSNAHSTYDSNKMGAA